MATAQLQRPKTAQKEVTAQQSLGLMKNLVKASMSEVCYLRNLFPEDCFKPMSFGNTTVRALLPSGPDGKIINEDAARLSAWQEAAFKALELGYLRCIVFGIYSAEDDPADRELLESYVYHFKYPGPNEIEMTLEKDASSFTTHRVRDQAVTMVRTLIRLCETMKPVPEQRVISLKLFYYDDRTPADYQPMFFSDATHEDHKFYSSAPYKVTAGSVSSKHHGLTLKVAFKEDMMGEEEADSAQAEAAAGATGAGADVGASSSMSAPSTAAAEPEASSAQPAQSSLPLPEGVSSSVYVEAVGLITGPSHVCTAKALQQGLASLGVDASNEQVRRMLKHAAAEGYLQTRGSNRYETAPHVFAGAAAASAAGAAGGAGAAESSAGAEPEDEQAKDAAAAVFARAMVLVLHTWPEVEGKTHVTVPAISRALSTDTEFGKGIVDALEADGVLLPVGAGGAPTSKGRAIVRNDGTSAKLQLAITYMRKHGMQLPHTLADDGASVQQQPSSSKAAPAAAALKPAPAAPAVRASASKLSSVQAVAAASPSVQAPVLKTPAPGPRTYGSAAPSAGSTHSGIGGSSSNSAGKPSVAAPASGEASSGTKRKFAPAFVAGSAAGVGRTGGLHMPAAKAQRTDVGGWGAGGSGSGAGKWAPAAAGAASSKDPYTFNPREW